MAASALEIVNSALIRLGVAPIDSGAFTDPATTNPAGLAAQAFYAVTRDEEFRANPWVFTLIRATLLAYTEPAAILTPAAATGSGITFTADASVFVDPDDVGKTLEHQAGTGKAIITAVTDDQNVVADITEDFPNTNPIAAGDWRLYNAAPANTWLRTIEKPTPTDEATGAGALLRLWYVRHRVAYRAEGQHFVTDADSLDVVYIARVVDTTLFDPDFEEALAARLAIKFAYAVPGKLDLLDAMSKLYGAVIQRAKSTSAIEIGEGKYETDPDATVVGTIIQDAVYRVGSYPAPAGGDPVDPTEMANHMYPGARDELLRLWPWRFARKRVQLDATTTVTLTPSATTGTGVTFTASGPIFTAQDVGYRILANTGGTARITAFTSSTVVTGDVITDFPDLTPVPAGSWHVGPVWQWAWRYPKPADYLRLTETQCPGWWVLGPVIWTWWGSSWGWGYNGQRVNEPAQIEGQYINSDAGPTLLIEYVASLTDVSLYDPTFRSALAALLAARMAGPLTGKVAVQQIMEAAFEREMRAVRLADKLDTTVAPIQPNRLILVRQ